VSDARPDTIYRDLLTFLARLDEHRVRYTLIMDRPEAVMVEFAMPGVR
jgi:hypothetical protein